MKNSTTFTFIGIALVAMICRAAGECIYMPDNVIEVQEECRKNHMSQRFFGFKPGCMAACVFEKLNFMVDDRFVPSHIEDFFNEHITDSELAERINDRMRFSAMRANLKLDKCDKAFTFVAQNGREEQQVPLMNLLFC